MVKVVVSRTSFVFLSFASARAPASYRVSVLYTAHHHCRSTESPGASVRAFTTRRVRRVCTFCDIIPPSSRPPRWQPLLAVCGKQPASSPAHTSRKPVLLSDPSPPKPQGPSNTRTSLSPEPQHGNSTGSSPGRSSGMLLCRSPPNRRPTCRAELSRQARIWWTSRKFS